MTEYDFPIRSRVRYRRHWLKLFALFVLVSCAPKQEEMKTVASVVPNDWNPSLEQVQQDVQELFERSQNKSQQALNRRAQNLAELADARLFIAYVRLMDTLEPPAKARLFNEQKEWLSRRADSAHAAVTSRNGSLAPLEYSVPYRKLTEERLAELEERLKHAKDESSPKR